MLQGTQRTWSVRILCTLLLSAPAIGAPPRDPAELMPLDALAFVGWSDPFGADKIAEFEEVVQAMVATAKPGDSEQRLIAELFDLARIAAKSQGAVGLLELAPGEEGPDIQLALVMAGSDAPGKIAERLGAIARIAQDDKPPDTVTIDGVAMQTIHIPGPKLAVLWGAHQGVFFATLGEPAAHKIIQRLNGQGPSLATHAELKFDRAKVGAGPGQGRFEAFLDLPAIVAKARALIEAEEGPLPPMVDAAMEALGIRSIRSVHVHVQDRESVPVCKVFTHVDGPLEGVLSLWRQQPLSQDDLKLIAKDAYWAIAGNFDLKACYGDVLKAVERISPESVTKVQGATSLAAAMMGFPAVEDMLSVFGDTWVAYDARDHGGLILTGAVLVAEVKDREALEGLLARVIGMVNGLAMGKVTLVQKETVHGPHTIHYVLIGGVPCPVAPAWGFAGDRWVFGLLPQTVAEAMKQAAPKTRKSSILDHAGFQASRKQSPESVAGIVYVDARHVARLFYPIVMLLQTAGVSQLALGGLSLDLQQYPPLLEWLEGVRDVVYTESSDEDGILCVYAGSGAPLLVAVSSSAMVVSVMLPSLSRARELSKRLVSAANLKGIATSCKIYAIDHEDRFPTTLQELVDEGLISPRQLESPSDPPGTVSYVYVAGQTEASDSRNVLAYERVRADEGTNVAFVDGHVQWVRLEEFKRALLETYQRLGREAEMPAELRP